MNTNSTSKIDPATNYAMDVVDGKFPTSIYVKGVCQRHLDDLDKIEDGKLKHLSWEPERANRVYAYLERYGSIMDHKKRQFAPLRLMPAQMFMVGMLFGWIVKAGDPMEREPGTRRYRWCYLCSGKGYGKSSLFAAIMVYLMSADNESEANCYVSASTKGQAKIAFELACRMHDASPELQSLISVIGRETPDEGEMRFYMDEKVDHTGKIARPVRRGMLQVLPYKSKAHGLHGKEVHAVLFDEYHEHSSDEVMKALTFGSKGKIQPMFLFATNAGESRTTPCWEQEMKARDIAIGKLSQDDYLPLIYEIDEEDDPIEDDRCWTKANPGLGITIQRHKIISEMANAQGSPAAMAQFQRLFMGRWPESPVNVWLEPWVIRRAMDMEPPTDEELLSWNLYLGADLANRRDLTAIAAWWVKPDGSMAYARAWGFLAQQQLDDLKQSTTIAEFVSQWTDSGHLVLSGEQILDFGIVAKHIKGLISVHKTVGLAFDNYLWRDLEYDLREIGIECVREPPTDPEGKLLVFDHPQGTLRKKRGDTDSLLMHTSMNSVEKRILLEEPTVILEKNPYLAWDINNALVNDTNKFGIRYLDKAATKEGKGRNDATTALTMASGLSELAGEGVLAENVMSEEALAILEGMQL